MGNCKSPATKNAAGLWMRPDTLDQAIWDDVNTRNEYGLPDNMSGEVVLDIGGHIGAFASACMDRGAEYVFSVEACYENYVMLCNNLRRFGSRVGCAKVAAWSDSESRLTFVQNDANTGNGRIVPVTGGDDRRRIFPMAFDYLAAMATKPGVPFTLLKLDCEGSEWPILFASKKLRTFERIIGEYHDGSFLKVDMPDEWCPSGLRQLLSRNGFTCDIRETGDGRGLFFADRVD